MSVNVEFTDDSLERIADIVIAKLQERGMSDIPSSDEGITADEAARLIGVKRWRVYEMIQRGVLPAYHPSPQRLRIRLSAVRAFMSSDKVSNNGNE